MAAIPCAGGTRANAFITKFEKAKKIPATRPEPSAARNVSRQIGLFIEIRDDRAAKDYRRHIRNRFIRNHPVALSHGFLFLNRFWVGLHLIFLKVRNG